MSWLENARSKLGLLLLAACAAVAAYFLAGTRLPPADVTFNNNTEIQSLDPAAVTGVPEGRVLRAIYEGLVNWHPATLAPVPAMAEKWTISKDGRTYVFTIRKGARWSNGDEVTAHDFEFSWRRFLDPRTAAEYSYQLWYVAGAERYSKEVNNAGEPTFPWEKVGIRATGRYELTVQLTQPTPYFINLCGFYVLFPIHRKSLEEAQAEFPKTWRTQWLDPERLVTNGPFRVEFRRVNDRIRLRKNPEYWDADRVAMRTIDVLTLDKATSALNLYLTGGCQWLDTVPEIHVPRLMEREDFDPQPQFGVYFYRLNVTRPPFDDVRVRRALAYAVNREEIVETITLAGQQPAYSVMPPFLPDYPSKNLEIGTFDDSLALLAEAGYGPQAKPFPTIEILYNTQEAHRAIAEKIAASWRQLGLRVKLLNQEWKVYLDTQKKIDYDVCRSAWIGDYLDPNTFLNLFVTDGANNRTGWGDPRYDDLIRAAEVEVDPEKRMRIFQKAEAILLEQLPVIPIHFYVTRNLVNPRLGGFHENIMNVHPPKYWYWMSDEELAAKRAREDGTRGRWVPAEGPADGLYSPAMTAERAVDEKKPGRGPTGGAR